jgi:hypothetical protein
MEGKLTFVFCISLLLAVLSAAADQLRPWVGTPISATGVLASTTASSCYCTDIPDCTLGSPANNTASDACSCANYDCGMSASVGGWPGSLRMRPNNLLNKAW